MESDKRMMDEICGVYDGDGGGGRWEVGVARGAASHAAGVSYGVCKMHDKCIAAHERALRMQLDTLGEQHPASAETLSAMGVQNSKMGNHDVAIWLQERALRIFKDTLGQHPATAQTMSNMGATYSHKGQHLKAMELYEQALRIYELTVGRMHRQAAGTILSMSSEYGLLGDLLKAKELGQEAVDIYIKTLGPKHEETITARENLGYILMSNIQKLKGTGAGRFGRGRSHREEGGVIRVDNETAVMHARILGAIGKTPTNVSSMGGAGGKTLNP
jgi:tetratricopeptide (TPR) repeat protein